MSVSVKNISSEAPNLYLCSKIIPDLWNSVSVIINLNHKKTKN